MPSGLLANSFPAFHRMMSSYLVFSKANSILRSLLISRMTPIFAEGLNETVDYIKSHQDVVEKRYEYSENHEGAGNKNHNDDFSF
jgi:hypothetical protein